MKVYGEVGGFCYFGFVLFSFILWLFWLVVWFEFGLNIFDSSAVLPIGPHFLIVFSIYFMYSF